MIKNQVVLADISFWQDNDYTPYKVDFTKAWKAGLDGVILRAGQNTWMDEDYLDYARNADAAGLPRGAYWFFDSRVSPEPQADRFADIVQMSGAFPQLGVWADYEENYGGVYGGEANFKLFINKLQARFPGKLVGVYTGPDYWKNHTTLLGRVYFSKFPLWIAHYKAFEPTIPSPWGKYDWKLWQYTAEGYGPMFGAESEEIDLNFFNGTLEDYRQFFAIPEYQPAPQEELGEGMKLYRVQASRTPYINLRATPNGADIGDVYPNTEFTSDTFANDSLGRPWLHSPSLNGYVLDAFCDFIREIPDSPEPVETHVLEVYIDGELKSRVEY
jgi:GH25 family lysozyme M1 (1,4-beta-N-acetylmuramidase)